MVRTRKGVANDPSQTCGQITDTNFDDRQRENSLEDSTSHVSLVSCESRRKGGGCQDSEVVLIQDRSVYHNLLDIVIRDKVIYPHHRQ